MFFAFRKRGIDLAAAAVITPTLAEEPSINSAGILIAGFLPHTPFQFRFELLFQNVNGAWRPAALSVDNGDRSALKSSA